MKERENTYEHDNRAGGAVEAGVVRCVPRDDRGMLAFKGIPFADPPVGDLRCHAPQPPQAWSGVRAATQGFGLATV